MPNSARLLAMSWGPLLAAPLVLVGADSRAQDAAPLSAAQSASLDRAIRLWTNSPTPSAPAPAYTVTPEGDHYRLDRKPVLPAGATEQHLQGGDLTATVRPLDGGRWQFDDIKTAMPIVLSTPPIEGRGASQTTIDMQGQTGRALVDPSLTTPSTFDGSASSATGTFNVPPQLAGSFRLGAITTHGVWRPAGPGRVDRSSAAALGDMAMQFTGKQAVSMTVGAFHGETLVKGLSPDHLADLLAFLRDNLPGGPPAPGPAPVSPPADPSLTPADRLALHTALDRVRELASGVQTDGTFDDIALVTGGHTVKLRQVTMSESLAAPGGRLDGVVRMILQGLSSPDIPRDIAHNLVPHRIVVAPHVSGISVDGLFDLLNGLIDGDAKPGSGVAEAAALTLLARAPVSIGLDELAFDVGPALLAGSGSVKIAGPARQDITGNAVIEAKGFNALIKRSNTDPMLRQAAPVLIFLKGIGDQDDSGSIIWKVVYADGKMLVNGADLSQLVPHK